MRTEDKKQPALTDTDPMPFGKYKGDPMQDVPASYLEWLYETMLQEGVKPHNEKVFNYIWNSKDALAEELGHVL